MFNEFSQLRCIIQEEMIKEIEYESGKGRPLQRGKKES